MWSRSKVTHSQASYNVLASVLTNAAGGAIGGWLSYHFSLSVTVARQTCSWSEQSELKQAQYNSNGLSMITTD